MHHDPWPTQICSYHLNRKSHSKLSLHCFNIKRVLLYFDLLKEQLSSIQHQQEHPQLISTLSNCFFLMFTPHKSGELLMLSAEVAKNSHTLEFL